MTLTQRFRSAAPYVAVFLIAFLAWHAIIIRNWDIIRPLCLPTNLDPATTEVSFDNWDYQKCGNVIHGADTQEYYSYLHNYPDTLPALTKALTNGKLFQDQIATEYYKRPLYGFFSSLTTIVIHSVTGRTTPDRIYDILALYAALATTLCFAMLRQCSWRLLPSLFGTFCLATSYAWFSILFVPESYSLSLAATLLVLNSGIALQNRMTRDGTVSLRCAVGHSILVAAASWIYLPAFGAIAFLLGIKTRIFTNNIRLLWLVLTACILTLMPQLVYNYIFSGSISIQNEFSYGSQWGGLVNFVNVEYLINVPSAFIIFSILPSSLNLLHVGGGIDWVSIFSGWRLTSMLIASFSITCIGIAFVWKRRDRRLLPFLLWLVGLIAFHIYFNPAEVLLYNSVPFAVVAGLVARSATLRTAPRLTPGVVAAGVVVALAVAAVNVAVVMTGISY
ncbi:hypothetical protein GGR25_001188 [Kaistia hirudinis]|uniref:Glycosyltransferase RgtA/B/C/D-like domain-containing protein n=1 Tax=Kaistia hirudinis TaxID=1293440 RepID=A0A840AIH4_9HYPH|nr:hypothetical protein [Kaistia hirudinis]MBB3930149.1 hypothetical protein [Kaistia hirudinis]